jgi:XisH protein
MSKRDRLHQALRRTLEKDGWTVTADPLILVLEQAVLRADLGAEKTFAAEKAGRKIAIEVKDFTAASGISELEKKRWGSFSFTSGRWRCKSRIGGCFWRW